MRQNSTLARSAWAALLIATTLSCVSGMHGTERGSERGTSQLASGGAAATAAGGEDLLLHGDAFGAAAATSSLLDTTVSATAAVGGDAGTNDSGEAPEGTANQDAMNTGNTQRRALQAKKQAVFRMHQLFTEGCMLSRGGSAAVLGFAAPGTTVAVVLVGLNAQPIVSVETVSTDLGTFNAQLGALAPGGPFSLLVTNLITQEIIEVPDVSVGDIWMTSGQSNMVMTLGDIEGRDVSPWTSLAASKLDATPNPNVRFFQVPNADSPTPQLDLPVSGELANGLRGDRTVVGAGSWAHGSRTTGENFNAIGYLLAPILQTQTGVPIGIIQTSKAGASIQTYVPQDYFTPDTRTTSASNAENSRYNAMVAPLEQVPMDGVIWYQGEADAGLGFSTPTYAKYAQLLQQLVTGWRTKFVKPLNTGILPFLVVQLSCTKARYSPSTAPAVYNLGRWAVVREAQRVVALANPAMSLVTAIDQDLGNDPHPLNKFDIAQRLQNVILGFYTPGYVNPGMYIEGPTFRTATFKAGGGANIYFKNVGTGLMMAKKTGSTALVGLGGKREAATKNAGLLQPRPLTRLPNNSKVLCFQVLKSNGSWIRVTGKLTVGRVTSTQTGAYSISLLRPSGTSGTWLGVRYAWADWPAGQIGCSYQLFAGGSLDPVVPFQYLTPAGIKQAKKGR